MSTVVVVQSLSCVWLFGTPWTTACQALLSSNICQSLLNDSWIYSYVNICGLEVQRAKSILGRWTHSRGSTEVSSHSFFFLLYCRFYSLKGSSSFILWEHELGWLPVSWSLEFYPWVWILKKSSGFHLRDSVSFCCDRGGFQDKSSVTKSCALKHDS